MQQESAERVKNTMLNGVDVDQFFGTIDAIKDAPDIAKFNFRINNKWINGGHNHTTIRDFHGAQEDHLHEKAFELDADEPPVLLGEDKGPNPVEYVLKGLATCVTTSLVYHAAAKGIEIKGVESRLDGDLDLRGFLGLSEDVPVGYEKIRMFFKIDADIPEEQKEELIKLAKKHSPVFNTISNATPIFVQLEK